MRIATTNIIGRTRATWRALQVIVLVGSCFALRPEAAPAHGIAGNRLFPGTLTFDDPAVADELSAPDLSKQTHPVLGDGNVRDTSVGGSFSRLLLPDLALRVDSDWTEHGIGYGATERGMGATHLSLKYQAYRNEPHETLIATGFAFEYSTLYLTDRFTGGPPSAEPVNQFVPLVEFQFDTPLDGGYGRATAGTANPGIAYMAGKYQLSAEAIVPLNRAGGSSGFRVGAIFFLDDLVPSLFGKPVLH